MELIVDLLVHGCGDDAHLGEGVGYGVNAHLSHQQRQQEDLILLNIMVLEPRSGTRRGVFYCLSHLVGVAFGCSNQLPVYQISVPVCRHV